MIIIWNAIIAAFNAEEFNYSGVIVNLVLEDLLSGNRNVFICCVCAAVWSNSWTYRNWRIIIKETKIEKYATICSSKSSVFRIMFHFFPLSVEMNRELFFRSFLC